MPRPSIPVARLSALIAVIAGAWVLTHASRTPHWRALRDGLEFTTIRGEPYCRHGSAEIAVLRLDPARVRLHVLHYTRSASPLPMSIVQWQRSTGALAVFNAGQFYPDYSYMGLLASDGEVVSPRLHPTFRAALVAAPGPGHPRARVLDLEREPLDPDSLAWPDVAQSFMLFDDRGARVRRSGLVAHRTVVAEDVHGHVLVFTSEGGYTLFDFARLLQDSPFALTHAMGMDGGDEAELLVNTPGFRYASFGHFQDSADAPAGDAQTPLPAVVAVSAP